MKLKIYNARDSLSLWLNITQWSRTNYSIINPAKEAQFALGQSFYILNSPANKPFHPFQTRRNVLEVLSISSSLTIPRMALTELDGYGCNIATVVIIPHHYTYFNLRASETHQLNTVFQVLNF